MSTVPRPLRLPRGGPVRSLVDFYLTSHAHCSAAAVPVPRRDLLLHARDGRRARDLPRRLDDDRGAARAARSAGFTSGYFAAYYIVWTLVRNMNIVFGAPLLGVPDPGRRALGRPPASRCIRSTTTSPSSPVRRSSGFCSGPPDRGRAHARSSIRASTPGLLEIAVFAVAIWGAYLIRTIYQSTLGMLCFWTTRGAAIFDL